MPRYYFHLHNDVESDDREGKDLPDVEAARATGVRYARDMIAVSVVERGTLNLRHSIRVADDSGEIVAHIEFGDVVAIER